MEFNCGKRLRELVEKTGLQKQEFAAKINTPPTTLSGWFGDSDILLENIRKCCEVFNIQLYEFFIENDNVRPDYVPSWVTKDHIEILSRIRNDLSEEDGNDLLRILNLLVSVLIRKNSEKTQKLSK